MRLEDRVNKFHDGEVLFIGSGSSFFFIGTKAEFNKYISRINKYEKDKFITFERSSRAEMKKRVRGAGYTDCECAKVLNDREYLETIINEADEAMRVLGQFSKEFNPILRRSGQVIYRLKQSCKAWAKASDRLNEWVNIRDREVLEMYVRPIHHDGIAIIVPGYEMGDYWDRDEFQRAVARVEAGGSWSRSVEYAGVNIEDED